MRTRALVVPSALFLTALLVAGCRKTTDPPADEPETTTVTEENENGTVAWDVNSDGSVRAVVKKKDGTQIKDDVTGTLTWPGTAADAYADVTVDSKGFVIANGPALEDDLTEIDYTLTVEGKPWAGVLMVPKGGTKAIEEDAQASASVNIPDGKTGPNGGVIQYVGKQPVELVADKSTGEVRIYMLDSEYKVMEPDERSFRIGYVANYPETVVMVREPGAPYFVGRWGVGVDPFRVTVAMTYGVETHCAIVGWHYGQRLAWGAGWGWGVGFGVGVGVGVGMGVRAGFPMVRFAAERHWAPSVAVRAGYGYDARYGVRERVSVHVNEHINVHERVHVNEHINVHEHEHGGGERHEHGDRGDHDRGGRGDHDRGGGDRHVNEHVNSHVNEHVNSHGGGHSAPSRGGGGGRRGGKH